jgi:hypothetical protein
MWTAQTGAEPSRGAGEGTCREWRAFPGFPRATRLSPGATIRVFTGPPDRLRTPGRLSWGLCTHSPPNRSEIRRRSTRGRRWDDRSCSRRARLSGRSRRIRSSSGTVGAGLHETPGRPRVMSSWRSGRGARMPARPGRPRRIAGPSVYGSGASQYVGMERCPICGGIGWVLDAKPSVEPLGLELLSCFLPGCQWSGRAITAVGRRTLPRRCASSEGWQGDVPHGGSSGSRHGDPLPHRLQAKRAVRPLRSLWLVTGAAACEGPHLSGSRSSAPPASAIRRSAGDGSVIWNATPASSAAVRARCKP